VIKIFKILFLLPFFLIASCETITDWTESIIPGDDEVVDESENNQELVSDPIETSDPTLAEILADSENEENFEIADEQLSAAPAKEYDSVLIDENEETSTVESTITQTTEIVQEDPSETIENILKEQAKVSENERPFKAPESLLSSLNLKEKIQYRVATITFRSGSSTVDGSGLKKIKKIVKIAKDRNAKIKIIGHASERTKDMPIAEHKIVNFVISDKRAHSVAKIFIEKHSFPRSRLITEAVSDSKPLFKEIMPAGTKANQRTEIFLIY
jgi:flagellar motor protein MotB